MPHKKFTFKQAPVLIFLCLILLTSCNTNAEIFIGTVHTIDVENKRLLVSEDSYPAQVTAETIRKISN